MSIVQKHSQMSTALQVVQQQLELFAGIQLFPIQYSVLNELFTETCRFRAKKAELHKKSS